MAYPSSRSGRRRSIAAIGLVLLSVLAGCATPLPQRSLACDGADAPPIARSADGRMASTRLRVLTYNIEGLGWPARSGRRAALREIGDRLARMRALGDGPDVILFQEMFSGAAKQAVAASGYPAIVTGPGRTTRADDVHTDRLPGRSNPRRGEIGLRLAGGGLAIASRYPISHMAVRAYGRRSCAGIDCLANKGIMLARIRIPGLPTPVDIYDTHMNSRGASRVATSRNLEAHDRQSLEASAFIDQTHDDSFPLIFGGDFNMRRSEERWENFTRHQALRLAHRECADPASGCDVRVSWDGDAPWMDTQDLQFFWDGMPIRIQPIRVEALFDGGPSGPRLSDHDGFLVTYELSWPVEAPVPPPC